MKAFPTKKLKKLSYFPFCFEEDTYKIRIHLPMQETRAQSLVQEDPICHGAQGLEPTSHNY